MPCESVLSRCVCHLREAARVYTLVIFETTPFYLAELHHLHGTAHEKDLCDLYARQWHCNVKYVRTPLFSIARAAELIDKVGRMQESNRRRESCTLPRSSCAPAQRCLDKTSDINVGRVHLSLPGTSSVMVVTKARPGVARRRESGFEEHSVGCGLR